MPVRARLGDGAHDAARRAAELGAVAVRLHAEFLDGVDAEQDARQARGRLVGDVGDVRAVHQVAGLLGTRAADRELRGAEAAGEVARRRAADDDARLQGGELHEAAAVERQLRNLLRRDDAAGRRRAQRDVARLADDRDLLGRRRRTFISMSASTSLPMATVRSLRRTGAKPESSALTVYGPGGRSRTR